MRDDLKFSAVVAAAVAVPLFLAFGWLWNPHGSVGSFALHMVGLFGIYPFLYVAESLGHQSRLAGLVFASLAQYLWVAVWVFSFRRIWRAWASR